MSLGGNPNNYTESYEDQYEDIYDNLNSLLNDYKDDAKNIYENRNGFQRVANTNIIGELETFRDNEVGNDLVTVEFIISADGNYQTLSYTLQEKFINLRSKYLELRTLIQRYISLKKQRLAATRNAKNAANKAANSKKAVNAKKGRGIAEKRKTRRK